MNRNRGGERFRDVPRVPRKTRNLSKGPAVFNTRFRVNKPLYHKALRNLRNLAGPFRGFVPREATNCLQLHNCLHAYIGG